MIRITAYTIEHVPDRFGILSGRRFEFVIEFDVDEEDELYTEDGLNLRVIFKEEDGNTGIVKYELYERTTNRYLDFELEPEELDYVDAFCREHYLEADE